MGRAGQWICPCMATTTATAEAEELNGAMQVVSVGEVTSVNGSPEQARYPSR